MFDRPVSDAPLPSIPWSLLLLFAIGIGGGAGVMHGIGIGFSRPAEGSVTVFVRGTWSPSDVGAPLIATSPSFRSAAPAPPTARSVRPAFDDVPSAPQTDSGCRSSLSVQWSSCASLRLLPSVDRSEDGGCSSESSAPPVAS